MQTLKDILRSILSIIVGMAVFSVFVYLATYIIVAFIAFAALVICFFLGEFLLDLIRDLFNDN